jgi:hypothetical protein
MAAFANDGQPETQQTLRGAVDRKAAGLDASSLHTWTTAAGRGKEERKGGRKGGKEEGRERGGVASSSVEQTATAARGALGGF